MANEKKLIIATHNGQFHADDASAVAVLLELNPGAEVVRTRDPEVIKQADFAVDVGGEWEPAEGRFDHHQKDFPGQRLAGPKYASSGLVWLAYGKAFISKLKPELNDELVLRVRNAIDKDLIQYLDMADTGESNAAPGYFGLAAAVSAFNPSRHEEAAIRQAVSDKELVAALIAKNKLDQFMVAVRFMHNYLCRLVEQYAAEFLDEELVRQAPTLEDGRILVLEESGMSWQGVICREMPDVLYVVYPDSSDKHVHLQTIPVEPQSFVARKDLPAAWAGLRGEELAKVTGVEDSVFCHNARFIAGAVSKEGAIQLAKLAVSAK